MTGEPGTCEKRMGPFPTKL